jgi:hypothetical protein
MSVWTSAIIEHSWPEFSEESVRQISQAASFSSELPERLGGSGTKSAVEDFKVHGDTSFFLPADLTLHFYGRMLEITLAVRWSTFLIDPQKRNGFLLSCKSVAKLTSATELIFMPEGVADLFINRGTSFLEFKQLALEKLGAPDIDIRKNHTLKEVQSFAKGRVHYSQVAVADIDWIA